MAGSGRKESSEVANKIEWRYEIDGVGVPSVTQILRLQGISKSLDGAPMHRIQEGSRRGHAVHGAIEDILVNGTWDDCLVEPDWYGFIRAAKDWIKEDDPEVLKTEIEVLSPTFRFGGRTDLLCLIDGELTLVDYKTGPKDKAHGIQLAGYEIGLCDNEEFDIEDIERRLVIYLTKDGKFTRQYFSKKEDGAIFLHALECVHWRIENKRA